MLSSSRSILSNSFVVRKNLIRTLSRNMSKTAQCETSMGTFKVELYGDELPITVGNFIDLSNSGYYNGLEFHRVIDGFMCQFGCPYSAKNKSRAGTGGPDGNTTFKSFTGEECKRDAGGNIKDEFVGRRSNEIGTFSMANTGQPNSGGSQFFINVKHNSFLDHFDRSTPSKHPVFGKVIEGLDVIKAISKVPTNRNDMPDTPVVMEKITIV